MRWVRTHPPPSEPFLVLKGQEHPFSRQVTVKAKVAPRGKWLLDLHSNAPSDGEFTT